MFIDPKDIVEQLHLEGDEAVADLGCGSGAYSLLLAKKLAPTGGKVYAIDVQQDMLTRLAHTASEERLSNVSCVHADLEKLNGVPLRDGIAQLVILSNVLYCTEKDKRKEVVAEASRLLANHGKLLLIDWTGPHKGVGPEKEQVIDREHGLQLASNEGLALVADLNGGGYHWAILLDKAPTSEAKKHFAL